MAGFISAERVSALAVELLARTIVLPATVTRVPVVDYTGSGGRVLIRVPQRREAKEFSGTINYDNINEDQVEVDAVRWYDGVNVTTEQKTLEVVSFGQQVIAPMVTAIAEAGEQLLGDAMNDLTPEQDWTDLSDPDKTRDDVLQLRAELTQANVPLADRTLACAPDVASAILRILARSAADTGSDAELRSGVVGRFLGFTIVESNALAPGSGVAYHRSGFAFTTMAPALPEGGVQAARTTNSGIALRTVYAFDPSTGDDVILLDTFGGAAFISNAEDGSDSESSDVVADNGPRAIRFAPESS
jgi:hypothetical protein